MQFANETTVVEKSGMNSEKKFGLRDTRKMFRVLFNTLYSNKIRAIVRELYSNAYDSHLKAGRLHVQPELHLPTAWEPEFYIRDFGTGIHPEDIENIYTVVLESTKCDSDDEIGGFGLGSKTPFCYTSSFGVRSFHDGMVYSYAMYINEEGDPAHNLVASEETTEPDGLEVRFAVERDKFKAFETETADSLRYFTLKPVLTGAKVVFPEVEKVLTGDKWYTTKAPNYYGAAKPKPIILVGPVAYPIDVSSFADSLTPQMKALAETSLTIEAGICDVEVAPSREALSYSDNTVAYIKDRLASIVQEMTDKVAAQLAHAKSDYEKKALYQDVMDNLNFAGNAHCINTAFIFGSNMRTTNIELNDLIKKELVIHQIVYDRTNGSRLVKKFDHIKPTLTAKFYYDDGCVAPLARCEHLVESDAGKSVIYLIKGPKMGLLKDDFIRTLGINEADLLPTGSLPYVRPKVQRSSTGSKVFRAAVYEHGNFKEATVDPNIEAYYVILRFNRVYGEGSKYQGVYDFHNFMTKVAAAGIILDKPVYGLRTDTYNKVKKNAKWVNLFDDLKNRVASEINVAEFWTNYLDSKDLYANIKHIIQDVPATSEFAQVGNRLVDCFEKSKEVGQKWKVLSIINNRFLENQVTPNVKVVDIRDEFNTALKKYPIIKAWSPIFDSCTNDEKRLIADYVKLIG